MNETHKCYKCKEIKDCSEFGKAKIAILKEKAICKSCCEKLKGTGKDKPKTKRSGYSEKAIISQSRWLKFGD